MPRGLFCCCFASDGDDEPATKKARDNELMNKPLVSKKKEQKTTGCARLLPLKALTLPTTNGPGGAINTSANTGNTGATSDITPSSFATQRTAALPLSSNAASGLAQTHGGAGASPSPSSEVMEGVRLGLVPLACLALWRIAG